jgi:integrase
LGGLIKAYQASPEWRALAGSSQVFYSTYLRCLRPMAHLELPVVTRRTIIAARNLIAEGRGNGAAQNFVQAVGAMFAWAVDQDWLDLSPVNKIKRLPHGHIPAWTPDEATRAMALPEPYRRVVVLALYTGQRRGDLCAMGWSAYDGTSIRLVQQKTRRPMVIPVHPDLKAELDQWERIATTILTNPGGRPWNLMVLSGKLPGKIQALGLRKGLNVHGLRKLAAANLAEAGCSTLEIAAITGHASLGMVQLYTKSADQERMATAAIVRLTRKK